MKFTPTGASNQFLSTSSARRTTLAHLHHGRVVDISIHVLREEDDDFAFIHTVKLQISIHVLREEDDLVAIRGFLYSPYFYPRPPRGGRHTNTRAILDI